MNMNLVESNYKNLVIVQNKLKSKKKEKMLKLMYFYFLLNIAQADWRLLNKLILHEMIEYKIQKSRIKLNYYNYLKS